MLISVTKSTKPGKKLQALFSDGRLVHFGSEGMDDYTMTHDKEQRARYISRHMKDLESGDPTKPGYLAMFLLWGRSSSIDKNVLEYKKLFRL
jgi:hypothetical protein